MCGRFTMYVNDEVLKSLYELTELPTIMPRYNIAPVQPVGVVRANRDRHVREFLYTVWGLIPAFAKQADFKYASINARAETISEKASFRSSFRHHRCLIPASGFYEWQGKQPYHFTMADGSPISLGGITATWHSDDGSILETCAVITTQANDLMAPIHDRMPVIISPEHFERWLDPELQLPRFVSDLLAPVPSELLRKQAANPLVNSVKYEGSDLLAPGPIQGSLF